MTTTEKYFCKSIYLVIFILPVWTRHDLLSEKKKTSRGECTEATIVRAPYKGATQGSVFGIESMSENLDSKPFALFCFFVVVIIFCNENTILYHASKEKWNRM